MSDLDVSPMQKVTCEFTRHDQEHALELLQALCDQLKVDHTHPFRGFVDTIRRAQPTPPPSSQQLARLARWAGQDAGQRDFTFRVDAWVELRDKANGVTVTGVGESADEAVFKALHAYREKVTPNVP